MTDLLPAFNCCYAGMLWSGWICQHSLSTPPCPLRGIRNSLLEGLGAITLTYYGVFPLKSVSCKVITSVNSHSYSITHRPRSEETEELSSGSRGGMDLPGSLGKWHSPSLGKCSPDRVHETPLGNGRDLSPSVSLHTTKSKFWLVWWMEGSSTWWQPDLWASSAWLPVRTNQSPKTLSEQDTGSILTSALPSGPSAPSSFPVDCTFLTNLNHSLHTLLFSCFLCSPSFTDSHLSEVP